jgi:crotonobetainyl-CoA:carnitine CoA-transferase CaiB-like acyl-CoA transferase
MSAPTPLSGLNVVEFTHMVMGPAAGAVLAALGANVVRVEPAEGDKTRTLLGSGAGYFPMYNRHKRSISLDLKSDQGLAVAKRLASAADILIENFRPGALDKLGLGYEALREINPRLIYCSAKGFLPGPYENRTALDEVAQMMGGLAYMTGPPGRPLRAGSSVIDVAGGMFGVIGVLAALEERHRTGKGRLVQASLFETTVYLVGQHMAQLAVTGKPASPMPARLSAWAIYDVFETKDDPIFIGVVTDALWEKFCRIFGLQDLWSQEDLRKNNERVRKRERILPRIRELIAGFTRSEVIERLEGTGLPFAPIGKPEDMFDDPHLLASGALEPVTLPNGTSTRLPTLPIAFDGALVARSSTLPEPGADGDAILRALGFSKEEIARMADAPATRAAAPTEPKQR